MNKFSYPPCSINPELKARYSYEKNRDSGLRKRYGITLKEYFSLLEEQQGKCAICMNGPRGTAINDQVLSVDHEEVEGEIRVRGLLCNTCNRAIGLFKDNIKTLQRAVEYLNGAN